MEDGVTIAVCLREAGKHNTSAGVKAYQDIRYDRVKAVQKTGETTRDVGLPNHCRKTNPNFCCIDVAQSRLG